MSLLSTFAILFETDASDAAKDIEGLEDALDGVSDAADPAAQGVDEFTDAVNANAEATTDLTQIVATLGAAYLSLDAVVSGVFGNSQAIDTVGKFSKTLGENIVEMDAWGAAAERNGGSSSAMRSAIEMLNTSLADIKISGGGEAINTLAMLGITATAAGGEIKSAFDILPELADSFQKMSANESFAFGKKLGLDQGTILLLQQGRGEVDKLVDRQRLLGGVTEEGYESAAKFNDAWDDTKRVFNSLWMSANSTILPVLTSIFSALEEGVLWIRQNSDLVEGFFLGAAIAITAFYLPAMAAAVVSTYLLIAPFALIAAKLVLLSVAIALVYEDLKAWVNGTKSLTGDLIGTFEDFKKGFDEIMQSISDEAKKQWAAFTGAFDAAGNNIKSGVDNILGYFTVFKDEISNIIDSMMGYFATLADGGKIIADAFSGLFGDNEDIEIKVVKETRNTGPDSRGEYSDVPGSRDNYSDVPIGDHNSESVQANDNRTHSEESTQSRIEENTFIAMDTIQKYEANPINNSSSNISNKSNSNSYEINVKVGAPASGTGGVSDDRENQVFGENLANSVRMAIGQLDDGVAR